MDGWHGGAHAQSYLTVAGMWLAMTALMMGPVVVPWLRALSRVTRLPVGGARGGASLPVVGFAAGYAVAWCGFALAAALLHTLVARGTGVAGPWISDAPRLSGAALVLAGGFQFTRLKAACLSHCRSPMGYLLAHWKPGVRGATELGLRHGLFCLGCCWAVMGLALVVGTMDLIAMAALIAIMLAELSLPLGPRLVRPLGALATAWGGLLLVL